MTSSQNKREVLFTSQTSKEKLNLLYEIWKMEGGNVVPSLKVEKWKRKFDPCKTLKDRKTHTKVSNSEKLSVENLILLKVHLKTI